MAAASRRSRRFVLVGVAYLLGWQVAALLGADGSASAVLGVLGFVLHVIFGKAYALVPSYFARPLASSRAAVIHLPSTAVGTALLAAHVSGWRPLSGGSGGVLGPLGASLWAVGVAVFLGTISWTIRDNLTGAETGTGEAKAHRRPVDRAANAVITVALVYLTLGSYELLASFSGAPQIVGGGSRTVMHLLAVGTGVTTLLGIGFRLLPRFMVVSPRRTFVVPVLAAGALGPALLAAGFGGVRGVLAPGAILEATAIVGFGLTFVAMVVETDRARVGFWGVLAGAVSGAAGVALGVGFALGLPWRSSLVAAHFRLNVLGFLGLSIVGAAYQFYPPAVGAFSWNTDRTALASIATLAGGLWLEALGRAAGASGAVRAGSVLGVLGAVLFASLLVGTLRAQSAGR